MRARRVSLVIGAFALACAGLAGATGPVGAQEVDSGQVPPTPQDLAWRTRAGTSLPIARSSVAVQNGSEGRGATSVSSVSVVPPGGVGAASVIPPDGRFRVNSRIYPHRAIGLLVSDFGGGNRVLCSGTLIGDNTVVTAGACLYVPALGGYVDVGDVSFFPGFDRNVAPFGVCRDTLEEDVSVHPGYESTLGEQYNYGFVKLHQCNHPNEPTGNIGNEVGFFGFYVQSSPVGVIERLTGYATRQPLFTEWKSKGAIKASSPVQLFYRNDTSVLEAGAPVYPPQTVCQPKCAMGINTSGRHGASGNHALYNHGIRINATVAQIMTFFRNQP